MKNRTIWIKIILLTVLVSVLLAKIYPQQIRKPGGDYQEKNIALDYLSQLVNVEQFGIISDAIWSFAELGLQEFKSARLLIQILEKEGFKSETGLAGMPTCFIATYGSGKPVIGILAEYDALPMLSQKGRIPYQDPLIEGAPGHGCGHNVMGTA